MRNVDTAQIEQASRHVLQSRACDYLIVLHVLRKLQQTTCAWAIPWHGIAVIAVTMNPGCNWTTARDKSFGAHTISALARACLLWCRFDVAWMLR